MPLYEYECERGHRFERIVKFSDPPIETCPECGARVHKLMSSPAFQFKGSGWYVTDYARKGADSKESTDAKEAKPAGEAGDAKESKEKKDPKTEKSASDGSGAKKTETASTSSAKSD